MLNETSPFRIQIRVKYCLRKDNDRYMCTISSAISNRITLLFGSYIVDYKSLPRMFSKIILVKKWRYASMLVTCKLHQIFVSILHDNNTLMTYKSLLIFYYLIQFASDRYETLDLWSKHADLCRHIFIIKIDCEMKNCERTV